MHIILLNELRFSFHNLMDESELVVQPGFEPGSWGSKPQVQPLYHWTFFKNKSIGCLLSVHKFKHFSILIKAGVEPTSSRIVGSALPLSYLAFCFTLDQLTKNLFLIMVVQFIL